MTMDMLNKVMSILVGLVIVGVLIYALAMAGK